MPPPRPEGTPCDDHHPDHNCPCPVDGGAGSRLSAAAGPSRDVEAVPRRRRASRRLDTARDQAMSTTAALERLLAIEVEATEARRLASRLRFASLPTPATLAGRDGALPP